jgi:hypothetical protein
MEFERDLSEQNATPFAAGKPSEISLIEQQVLDKFRSLSLITVALCSQHYDHFTISLQL